MLRPENDRDIPELTKLVAKNAFPQGSVVMTMRDELGPISEPTGGIVTNREVCALRCRKL